MADDTWERPIVYRGGPLDGFSHVFRPPSNDLAWSMTAPKSLDDPTPEHVGTYRATGETDAGREVWRWDTYESMVANMRATVEARRSAESR